MNGSDQSGSASWVNFGVERIEHDTPRLLVYRLTGTLSDTKQAYEFLDDFRAQARKCVAPTVVDLKGVGHVTSCGVGILAACYTSAANAGCRMCLTGLSKRVRAVVNVIGLLKAVRDYPSESEAIQKRSEWGG